MQSVHTTTDNNLGKKSSGVGNKDGARTKAEVKPWLIGTSSFHTTASGTT